MIARPHRGLYLITPDENDTARLLERVRIALEAGVAWLQYRNKQADAHLRLAQATALRQLCNSHGVPLIVNDDVTLARAIGADGVHLGEDDAAPEQACTALGAQALIGVSCYDDLARAERAVASGANYIAFGAFFPSSTKPNARRADLALLRGAAPLQVPRVAIGGITPDNAQSLIAAGADLVAVIAGVFDAPDPAAAVAAYNACFGSSA